jgi:hypothetical protein
MGFQVGSMGGIKIPVGEKFPGGKSNGTFIASESPLRFVIDEQRSFWGPVKSGDLPGTQVSGNGTSQMFQTAISSSLLT